MDKKKILEILRRKKEKISALTNDDCDAWQAGVLDYLEDFFGKESRKYHVFSKESFTDYGKGTSNRNIELAKPKFAALMDECIEYVENLDDEEYHL
jgi:hypothetical protein